MNGESKSTPTKAELNARVEQLRQSLNEAAQAEEEQKKSGGKKPRKKHTALIVVLIVLFLLAVLAVLLTQVLFGIARVSDTGMQDTLTKGTYVIFSRLDKEPERGNLVVIKDENGDKRVRFVAALKGDVVDYDRYDRRLFVDDKVAADDYVKGKDDKLKYPYTVGGSEVYVLCENRDDPVSEGVFPKKSIQGKVIMTL